MRVAVDVRSMMDAATGIGRIAGQLVDGLLALGHDVVGYSFGGDKPGERLSALVAARRMRLVQHPLPMRVVRRGWMRGGGPLLESVLPPFDLVLAAETTPPRTHAPVVAAVYDTLTIDHPEWFTRYAQRAVPENIAAALARTHVVMVLCATVLARLRARFPEARARICVVPPAVQCVAAPTASGAERLLFVGTREPRKGIGRVAEALLYTRAPLELCVVGRPGWGALPGQGAIDALDDAGRLDLRGYVSEAALARLRAGACAAVVPALDEGFGLPLLEAMAAGQPALASDIPVFREVAGDGAWFAPPGDTVAWSDAIDVLAADPRARRDLAERGLWRARSFDEGRQRAALAGALAAATGMASA